MGNPGRSSNGCALCRKRKIKCDEARPGCKRCLQIRKPCPGYPFQIQIDVFADGHAPPRGEIVHVNSHITPQYLLPLPLNLISRKSDVHILPEKEDKKPVVETIAIKPESVLRVKRIHELLSHHQTPTPAPKYDIQHQSVCYFVHLFCVQAERIYKFPVLDFIQSFLEDAPLGSPVALAATAVSRMTLADRYSGRDVRLQTGKEYVEALCRTNDAIRSGGESYKDETVVAVWLLGQYELINAVISHGRTPSNLDDEWQSHINHMKGAKHLLKLRRPEDFKTVRSRKVYQVFRAAVQMRLHILHPILPQERNEDLKLDLYQSNHEFIASPTARKATVFHLSTAELTNDITDFLAQEPTTTAAAEEYSIRGQGLAKVGEKMDIDMIDWNKNEPGWEILRVPPSAAKSTWSSYPLHALYYFESFWVYLYALRFLIIRIKLFEALIEVVRAEYRKCTEVGLKLKSTDFQISRYRTIIQMSASDIIGMTAYALGDIAPNGTFYSTKSPSNPCGGISNEINVVAAMQMIIPLKTLLRSEHTTAAQRKAADLALMHIGDGFRRQPHIPQ